MLLIIIIMDNKKKKINYLRRRRKVRSKVKGTASIPRLSVFRSNKGMYLQLIDDESGKTLVNVGYKELLKKGKTENKISDSFKLGKILAEKAIKKNIKTVIFDRGGYKYHGRVKAVADAAREAGLNF